MAIEQNISNKFDPNLKGSK